VVKYNCREGENMIPISNEKRALLIAAKKRGEKEEDIAKWLNVCKSSVGKIWKLYRDTGNYEPTPYPGRKPIISAEKWASVLVLVAKEPDKTLEEIIDELDLPIQKSRLSFLLIKAGYSFKKKQLTPQSRNEKTFKKSAKSLLKK
jgi:transposase